VNKALHIPQMSVSGLPATYAVTVVDEQGQSHDAQIAGENPLTLFVDKREIVTLMTLGTHPELLTLGYLRNQGLIHRVEDVLSVQVDWNVNAVAVTTRSGIADWDEKLAQRTVTTGCGQGTVFGRIMDELATLKLPQTTIRQSVIYGLLKNLHEHNEIYRNAGAVHGCALCQGTRILTFIEDVGRHNAVDAIAGQMWMENVDGVDKIFYTTGRLTSEMVIKVAQMRIPFLLSRSGVTKMGLDLARQIGVTLIARAKGRHFLVYNGAENIVYDARPERRNNDVHLPASPD
jgi:FdhD protein